MAETLISPGVLARENDQSFISQQPVTVGAAIIGPTVKGPVEIPTVVTSYSQYQNIFGTTFVSSSDTYTYLTSIAAYNYFQNGGESLLVARVVTGSYTFASSSAISASSLAATQPALVLETISKGAIMNSTSTEGTNGQLASGSADNIRWEVVNSSTSSGTFDLLVRRGDDLTNNKIVLETWTNLSLDPKAPNFTSKVIGDYTYNYNSTTNQIEVSGSYPNASSYIRVKAVNLLTPDYFDNNGTPKNQYTSSIPLAASGSFGGAVGTFGVANMYQNITSGNTQGVSSGSYSNMVNLLSNADDYRFNVMLTPGLIDSLHTGICTSIISNTQNRGDNIYVLDLVPYGTAAVTSVVAQASTRNTSYACNRWCLCFQR